MEYPSIKQYEQEQGKIYIGLLNGKNWEQLSVNCNDLEKATQFIDSHNTSDFNLYYSSSCFKAGSTHRTKAMINSVKELYADIDNETHLIMNVNDAIELIDDIEPYFDVEIPRPTRVLYTGHGIHLKWSVEGELKNNTVMCEFIMKALQAKVDDLLFMTSYWINSGYKVDKQATDIGRMLRLENTYNAKDPLCKIKTQEIYISERKLIKSDLEKYNLKLNGKDIAEITHRRASKKDNNKAYDLNDMLSVSLEIEQQEAIKKEWNLRTAYIWLKTNKKRLEDLEKLQKIRNLAEYNVGYRNTFIREYATILKCIENDKQQFLKTLFDVNNWFNKPLHEKEVISWAKTVWNNGKRSNQHKNETIINVLDIKEHERESFISILTKKEYLKRYYIANQSVLKSKSRENRSKKYADIKEETKKNRELRNKKICKLNKKGLSIREIANKTKCSKSTVCNVLKQK